jgi:probable phosphoglycerate mutase
MIKELYIIRHGETNNNRLGIVQGSGIDSELNQTGHKQSKEFYRHYNHIPFDFAYVSNLIRTEQTLEPFLSRGLNYSKEVDLREISWGVYEGQSYSADLKSDYQLMIQNWAKGNTSFALEGGESLDLLIARCQKFLQYILSKHKEDQRILICTHGRTIRCLICLLLDLPMTDMEYYKAHNTGLFKFLLNRETCELIEQNNIDHLQYQSSLIS